MSRRATNAQGENVPLWACLAEPVCHECMVSLMDEDDRADCYRELVGRGLSPAEASCSAWPEVEGCAKHPDPFALLTEAPVHD
jgi:hypothetical protein